MKLKPNTTIVISGNFPLDYKERFVDWVLEWKGEDSFQDPLVRLSFSVWWYLAGMLKKEKTETTINQLVSHSEHLLEREDWVGYDKGFLFDGVCQIVLKMAESDLLKIPFLTENVSFDQKTAILRVDLLSKKAGGPAEVKSVGSVINPDIPIPKGTMCYITQPSEKEGRFLLTFKDGTVYALEPELISIFCK